ncbi:Flagellar hook-basal body protein [Melioribacter roseus P3M-2]|uniref:Flagellar hook-basal body complex protein FliE n=1 Tax=Melioribacter roseus (strain DSM 23840 / JCM 17771 / VKM B-2668 / P3M-2) TaxID=1191523 RepID=I7A2B8_MELRP|nr:flagellar hook-basal body complex protein FliE [Melioribacter roseus]AFN75358.1 Flagellar hook-basal body protein [Melioribacter roseus P3M-2]
MKIDGLSGFIANAINQEQKKQVDSGNVFADLLKSVNQAQAESAKAIEDFVAGNGVELHEVMIAGEKAKTSLDLLMEIRNKTIDMYKELTKIPI